MALVDHSGIGKSTGPFPQRLEWGPRVDCLAGVAELADALVLGTSSSECGFESLRPHALSLQYF